MGRDGVAGRSGRRSKPGSVLEPVAQGPGEGRIRLSLAPRDCYRTGTWLGEAPAGAPAATGFVPNPEAILARERQRWHSRTSFIMAAIGSAVGLGNVWRFPYVAYTSGGGAFLIPYFVALFTAGIPVLILEMGLGQRMQRAAPGSFGSVRRPLEWFGWWAAGLSAGIVIYYSTILSWSWVYLWHSLQVAWGTEPGAFFEQVLQRTDRGLFQQGEGLLGAPVWYLVAGMFLTWLVIYLILRRGVRNVSRVVLVTVPLPLILLAVLLIRGLTLPGAMEGIRYYLTPDFSQLGDMSIWLRAYGQIFFSLSLASGVMIAYGSFLPRRAEITNSALITGLANCGTSFFAGFAVFSMLGYLAQVQQLPIQDVTDSGTGLAFVTYPLAISKLPALNALFGIIFFLTLLTLGIDSAFALQEAFTAGFHDKWKVSNEKLALGFVMIAFPISLIFTTKGGYYWFDIVDKWICDFGLVTVGLGQCLIVGYFYKTEEFRRYLNEISEVTLGRWWIGALRFITPAVLLAILIMNLRTEILETYGGYPRWTTNAAGWGCLVLFAVLGFFLWRRRGKE
ncbi:MAG: sodium-dependent transporter [Candidatus Eisenbacteria bacterium]|nr:sodium-dependent transporter [Candidatus Eisenbacteria bacterium]